MKRQLVSVALVLAMIVACMGGLLPTTAAAYSETVYQAEEAVLGGAAIDTDHTGFTGTGFVDQFDALGKYVDFSISVPSSGDYSLVFRYANAGGYYASAKVYFDGEYEALGVFPSLSDWNTWSTAEVGKYLTAGTHAVRIAYNNHAINLDCLQVEEKHESARSLYLSNAKDFMAIWQAAQLCSEDTATRPPRISELRLSSNWSVNQLNDYTGFFRDETSGHNYSSGEKFESEGFFDENGILRTNYLTYDGSDPSGLEISRDYTALPNMSAIVTRYTVKNASGSTKTLKILDMLNPSNIGNGDISASYDASKRAIIFNRSSASQPYIALGSFDVPEAYQVANDSILDSDQQNCSPWASFNANGTLKNNSSASAGNVSAGMMKTLTVGSGQTAETYFYISFGATADDLSTTISALRAQNGAYWYAYTSSFYSDWFASAKDVPDFSDPELALMYKRNLVMIKNTLRPGTSTGDGAHVATTNPYDYGYKVWTRDASVTALALDAAGFTEEGERYWRWLAARQLTTGDTAGSFNTCIDMWTNARAEFIEPEHDTIGWFLFGVYRHCLETENNQLRDALWTQLTAAANYVCNNIDEDGFGPHDFSIFEDMDNYGVYTYTQALYVAGLEAMAHMARDKGLATLADNYSGAASTIKSAINRDDTLSDGLWYPKGGYYVKDIRWDDSVSRIKDGAGLILFVTGVVDIASSRAQSTLNAFEEDLVSDEYGMARYATDTYYSKDSIYSPSGDEAVELSPSWPQISNWNAVCNVYLNNTQKASDIFNWNLHRTCAGYMVTGECVSDVTEKPCISTASEPTTAAAFILATLAWNGDLDLRIVPEISNAVCYRELTVHSGCEGDWAQYQYVPYYLDERNDAVSDNLSIKNVYMANDTENLYIRIDNESGTLPAFNNSAELFQISAYFQNANGTAAALSESLHGTELNHSFSYAVSRSSNANTINKYTAGNAWGAAGTISSAKVEWDPTTGRIELQIPFISIGITEIGTDTWLDTAISIGSSTADSDVFEIHYRLTGDQEAWLYGDFT